MPLLAVREGPTDWLIYSLADWWVFLLADLFPDWPSEPLIQWWWSGWVWPSLCQMRDVERICVLFSLHASVHWGLFCTPHPPFYEETRCRNTCYIWSLSVDLTVYNSSHSLVPLCVSMISWDCSVFLGRQCWNELYRHVVCDCLWQCSSSSTTSLFFSYCSTVYSS